ncbi:SusD/RagB family nutrient-binding outer membrane lipoprotein [Flavobacteriaceae bacterium F08102]|nr:SusD/RagB family nutrient-binding outer membrane lipoprotein [Flavobacteriaceae bacterium F08102]
MMKKTIKTVAILALLILGLNSCGDSYYDINTPADAVSKDALDMKDLMGPVLYNTVVGQYGASTVFGNYSQYFGSYGNGAAGKSEVSSTWSSVYLRVMPNLKIIKEKAIAQNAKHYEGVALIIEALNIGLATDIWDAVPYSQAANPSEYPHPEFDSQEQIYTAIFTNLDKAIQLLQAADDSFITIGNEDIIYQGDIGKWLRAAYTIKARYQLHLVQKGITTANDVLTNINNGFTSNDDNFLMNYPETDINPWYQNTILTRQTGNFYRAPNDQIISYLNGSSFPFQSGLEIDPRMEAVYENEDPIGTPWRGAMNGGDGTSSDGELANTYYKDGGYYTSATAPIAVITYAEAQFIKAEAAFLAGGGTTTSTGANADAYAAYMTGIAANMDQLDVDGSAYMADGAVDVGASNLTLQLIMKEKYIANTLNPETYNDFRRYNFSPDVFKDLALRLEDDDSDDEYQGQWFRRGIYPSSERGTNPDVVEALLQEPTVDVWWAQ